MLVGSRFWLGFDLVLNLRKGGGRVDYAFVRTKTESCDQLSHKFRSTLLCIVGEVDLINYSNMGWNLFLKNINKLTCNIFFGEKIWIVVTQITQKKEKKKKEKVVRYIESIFFGKNGLKSPYFMEFFGGKLPDLDN